MTAGGGCRIILLGFIALLVLTTTYVFYAEMIHSPWENCPQPIIPETEPVKTLLLEAEEFPKTPVPWLSNIFFAETSCALMNFASNSSRTRRSTAPLRGLRMNPRVACSIEAAARTHPRRPIYLVHTCPLDVADMWSSVPNYALQVLSLPNVLVWPVAFSDLAKGTILESVLREGKLARSKWPIVHASDAIRVRLLQLYGGTYLDTDVLMLKSLDDMKNFGALEEPKSVNSAVLNLAPDATGREVADACLKEWEDYRPDKWAYNGPQLLSRVLKKRCGTDDFYATTPEDCRGFTILSESSFYPVHYSKWQKFFQESGQEFVMRAVNNSIGVHLWNTNNARNNARISLSSMQPAAQIARRVCPKVVAAVGDNKLI